MEDQGFEQLEQRCSLGEMKEVPPAAVEESWGDYVDKKLF